MSQDAGVPPAGNTTAWAAPARGVVVGVDGSERNRAAVAYAVDEAATSGRALTLLAVLDEFAIPIPHHSAVPEDEREWLVLNAITAATHREHPHLTVHRVVEFGAAVSTLLHRSADEGLLVVGKRGHGAFVRMMVGSTSIAVAGRSQVPVVIVPADWHQPDHAHEPILVGLDPDADNQVTLRFARATATRRGVEVREVPIHAASELLAESAPAQLLVIGRHHDGPLGLGIGSVARSVLPYAEVPVAVVPDAVVPDAVVPSG